MRMFMAVASVAAMIGVVGCGSGDASRSDAMDGGNAAVYRPAGQVFTDTTALSVVNNRGAYVSAQCYTATKDAEGAVHNPCFSCHTSSKEPNYVNDWDLQERYAVSEYTSTNRWSNLFKDRSAAVAAISDTEILDYVRGDNYFDENRSIILAEILKNVPKEWDYDGDGSWGGYTPDCHFDFDGEGFDRAPDGSLTGWRAFGYYPFLGTFWPTNGSTDDVLIRLPEVMRQNSDGVIDKRVYTVNLAIVEALIKQTDIAIAPVDESLFGVDLNQNGSIDTADRIVYRWVKPRYDPATRKLRDFSMHYVGRAELAQIDNALHIAPGLYPEQTEFLHSVRYIDTDADGSVTMGRRLKELRYGRKTKWSTYAELSFATLNEIKEKEDFPERLRTITGDAEYGLNSGLGWVYQGFIEDKEGYLRPQTYEETLFCIGCHSGIGAIADSTFVFPRKFDHTAPQRGWYHWSQSAGGFKNIPEPLLADGRYEYTLYLEENHAGDEFRANDEVMEKFFDADGTLKAAEIATLHTDISHLIIPTAERALMLNKAYRVIVDEQSYIYGRDAHVAPVANVHEDVEPDQSSGVTAVMMERYPLQ